VPECLEAKNEADATHFAKYLVSFKYELIQILYNCIIDTDTRYLSENVSRYKILNTVFVSTIRILVS